MAEPIATTGDRAYLICLQKGLFPNSWNQSHLPHEHGALRVHPLQLLDGFGLAIANQMTGVIGWLLKADRRYIYAYPSHSPLKTLVFNDQPILWHWSIVNEAHLLSYKTTNAATVLVKLTARDHKVA